jgi:hypothetical protein
VDWREPKLLNKYVPLPVPVEMQKPKLGEEDVF